VSESQAGVREISPIFQGLCPAVVYRLKTIIEYLGERALAEIRTADVEDFIADLRKASNRWLEDTAHVEAGLNQLDDRDSAAHDELGCFGPEKPHEF
jgi:hypothetical protein